MPYQFPKISDIPFRVTFLKDVTIALRYAAPELDDSIMHRLKMFGRDTFGLDLFNDWGMNPVDLGTDDNQIKLLLAYGEVRIKVKFPRYKRFSDILEELTPVYEFFKILRVESVVEITIIKYNELLYNRPNEATGVGDVIKEVFTSDLYNYNNTFDQDSHSFNDVTRWEKKISFNPVPDEEVSIVYGFAQNEDNPLKGILILKPSISYKAVVPLKNLKVELQRINVIVNRAFQWAVSSELIKKLQGRNE